jgi:hypothetical protein
VAEARNVPLPEPAGMVSVAGTVRLVALELRAMVPPIDPLRTTVQLLEAPGATAPELHAMELMELIPPATATVPPVLVTATGSPRGEAPRVLLIVTGRALLPERVTDRIATTPSEIALVFIPHATHV